MAAAKLLQFLNKSEKFIQNAMNQESDAPATDKQLRYLERLGVDFDGDVTKKEASELIEANK